MLQKKNRLSTAAFDQHFKTGKRRHSKNLQVIHTHQNEFHGAAVVGKKVFKEAVKRNRLRRQLYGVLYRVVKSGLLSGIVIIIAKPGAKLVRRKELLSEAHELLAGLQRFRQ